MRIINLKNEQLSISISNHGAELLSIISNGDQYEYLWQADANYWNRHAPVLFPIVGKLKNDCFFYKDVRYHLSQHGFARDLDFKVVENSDDTVVFELQYSLNSLSVFPFQYLLRISYQLINNQIKVIYSVKNLSQNDVMYFSIGGHPAFNISNFSETKLTILPENPKIHIPVNEEVLLRLSDKKIVDTNELKLSHKLFKDGVIIYETPDETNVVLELTDINKCIEVSFDSMDYLAFWSPYPKQAPFVCIEPWCGLADDESSSGLINEKYAIKYLEPQNIFNTNYTISLS